MRGCCGGWLGLSGEISAPVGAINLLGAVNISPCIPGEGGAAFHGCWGVSGGGCCWVPGPPSNPPPLFYSVTPPPPPPQVLPAGGRRGAEPGGSNAAQISRAQCLCGRHQHPPTPQPGASSTLPGTLVAACTLPMAACTSCICLRLLHLPVACLCPLFFPKMNSGAVDLGV